MSFIVATSGYCDRLRQALERGDPEWTTLSWQFAPGQLAIGINALSVTSTDRSQVLFNGYLSNHGELERLLDLPYSPLRKNDADLILALIAHRGQAVIQRLKGCFAMVIIHPTQQIVATRDRLGGRTLYCLRNAGSDGHILSTRSAWVQRLSGKPFEADPAFMASHFGLRQGPPSGHSAFAAVREFQPGETLSLGDGRARFDRPALDLRPVDDYTSPADCVERFRELLEQAVVSTLPSTGDVACMLSGGMDSGPVAALADRALRLQGRSLRSISWALDAFPECDERRWVEMAASEFTAPPLIFDGSEALPFAGPTSDMINPDLPAFNSFRPLVMKCYELAAEAGCRVLLNANGGDGIYPPYRLLMLDRIRRRHWGAIRRDWADQYQRGGLHAILSDRALKEPLLRIIRRPASFPSWLQPAVQNTLKQCEPWPPEATKHDHPDYVRQLYGPAMSFGRAHESYFPGRLGIERRDPFQNEDLVRFMLHAPHSLSFRGGLDKWLTRASSKDLLPAQFRWKRRTGWLEPFWRAGLKKHQETLQRLLTSNQRIWEPYIKPSAVTQQLMGPPSVSGGVLLSQCVGFIFWHEHWAKANPRPLLRN
ncbi:MAG: asparagine synthase-related protein [Wenzhouxiangella sp.]